MTIITTSKVMRPRHEHDFYPTPYSLCEAALKTVRDRFGYKNGLDILDPGAGEGRWGQVAQEIWTPAQVDGVDIRDIDAPDAYDNWYPKTNFLNWATPRECCYDLVVGNPPYKYAEEFVRKSLELVNYKGMVVFLLRLAFLEGQARGEGLWKECPPRLVQVCSRRPSFTDDKKTDATAYMICYWAHPSSMSDSQISFLDWDYTHSRDTGQMKLAMSL